MCMIWSCTNLGSWWSWWQGNLSLFSCRRDPWWLPMQFLFQKIFGCSIEWMIFPQSSYYKNNKPWGIISHCCVGGGIWWRRIRSSSAVFRRLHVFLKREEIQPSWHQRHFAKCLICTFLYVFEASEFKKGL